MGGLSGSSVDQQTTISASPFDIQKADTARTMRNTIMPLLQAGLTGGLTPDQSTSMQSLFQQARRNAARFGIDFGTPQFQNYMKSFQDNFGQGNKQDLLTLAMRLYGASQPGSGGKTTTTTGTTDPGSAGALTNMISIAGLFA
jgi:hypothetical protein